MGLGTPLISGGNNLIKCLNVLSILNIVKHGLHDCYCYSAAGSGGVDVPLAMPGPQFPHWLVSHTVITTTTTGKWCRSGVQEIPRLLQTNAKRPRPLSIPNPQLCPPPRCRISQSIWRRMLWCFKHQDDLKNADTVSKKYLPQRMFRDPDSGQENDWGHSCLQWASHRSGSDLAWRWCGAMQHVHGTNPAQLQIICWIVT